MTNKVIAERVLMGSEGTRLVRDFKNIRCKAIIDGVEYHFLSKLEYRWAVYLQFQKETNLIVDWAYEDTNFEFTGEVRGPMTWLIDFEVITNDGTTEYMECKGYPEGKDISKARRFKERWPDEKLYFIFAQKPAKKHFHKIRNLQKYVDRIIEADKIFRQIKGLVHFEY